MMTTELKRKLRQLKKLEAQLRFGDSEFTKYKKYIWDEYFSTKCQNDKSVKYNMNSLLVMNHEELKEVFDEYFVYVYFQYFKENGMAMEGMYDVGLLSALGLPPEASIGMIKSRFRELAKKYHPDLGGDSDKFIELLDTYKKLIGDE